MNTRGILTLFNKETARYREVWGQTLIAPVVSNLLFMTIFGVAFSSALTILIPGLAAMGLMMNALQNPMGSLIVAKYTNIVSELLMIPLRGFEVALAYILAGAARGMLVGVITILIGFVFTPIPFAHPLLILVFSLLLGCTFSSLGLIFGAVFNDFDRVALVQNFIITPLVYLGGVFYSVKALPGFAGQLSHYNPVFYLVDGFRYSFLGTSDAPVGLSLLIAVILFAICFSIASWIFETGYRLKT